MEKIRKIKDQDRANNAASRLSNMKSSDPTIPTMEPSGIIAWILRSKVRRSRLEQQFGAGRREYRHGFWIWRKN